MKALADQKSPKKKTSSYKTKAKVPKKDKPEEALQKLCVNYMRQNYKNTVCFHPMNNVKPTGFGTNHIRKAMEIGANNKSLGVLKGIPDLIILSSRVDGPKIYGSLEIELKYGSGTTSPGQKKIHSKLEKDGQCVKVIYNLEDFMKTVDTYLGLPKP